MYKINQEFAHYIKVFALGLQYVTMTYIFNVIVTNRECAGTGMTCHVA